MEGIPATFPLVFEDNMLSRFLLKLKGRLIKESRNLETLLAQAVARMGEGIKYLYHCMFAGYKHAMMALKNQIISSHSS